jgi:dephospho-CoA kinase
VEAALLIESGYHQKLDRLVLVTCTRAQQLERLTNPASGRSMSRQQAEQRIAAQMTTEQKREATAGKLDEIDCSGSLEQTKTQVQKLIDHLKKMAASESH